jgi:hypothetical protein
MKKINFKNPHDFRKQNLEEKPYKVKYGNGTL